MESRKSHVLTEMELMNFNYRNGGNNYILKANANDHWVAFSKSIIERLKRKFGEDFYIVIYWNVQGDRVGYYKIPFTVVRHLFTEEHMTQEGNGEKRRWTFTITDHLLCAHANTNFSVDVRSFLNVTIGVTEIADMISAEEGQRLLALHKKIERDTSFIAKIKKEYRKRCPEMRCEICGFSFSERYGKTGEGYIEAHHKQPLSELREGTVTSNEEIAFVCANCHRMLHSRIPALRVEELTSVILK